MIRESSFASLPLSGVVGNPQARSSYRTSLLEAGRDVVNLSSIDTTPQEGVEAEISRLTWAVIDGKASHEDRERLSALVSAQHEFRRG